LISSASPATTSTTTGSVTTRIIALPRPLTADEQRQKFLNEKLSDGSNRFTCLLCQKVYTSRYNIRMHMNMHTGRNVHTCAFCGRFFAHKHVFESHVRTHTGEKPYECLKCGKSFGDRSNCTSHQKKCKNDRGTRKSSNGSSRSHGGGGGSNVSLVVAGGGNNNTENRNTHISNIPNTPRKRNARPKKAKKVIDPLEVKDEPLDPDEIKLEGPEFDVVDEDEESHQQHVTPQIVSVSGATAAEAVGLEDSTEEEEEEEEEQDAADYIIPSSELDVDDIVDDTLYDEDLEEIQIEPDIIDYGDDDDDDDEIEMPPIIVTPPPMLSKAKHRRRRKPKATTVASSWSGPQDPPALPPSSITLTTMSSAPVIAPLPYSCSFCGQRFPVQPQVGLATLFVRDLTYSIVINKMNYLIT
jgi:uncharacterized Zn-finger protein